MVKDPAYRSKKYDHSLDPDSVRDRFASQKGAMSEQQKAYFGEIALIEEKAKKIVEEAGVPTIEVAQYINVARKCYSIAKKFSGQTRTDEAQNVLNHWASRGLNGLLLARVCNLSGCGCTAGVPAGTPSACAIGSVLICGPDGWEALAPGVSCQVLHSRGPGLIPDWVDQPAPGVTDHGALGGLGDDDHLQYVLRSILTTHGDLYYRDGTGIQRLAPGVSGRVLQTQGAGAPPVWAPAPGGDPRVPRTLWAHAHIDEDAHFPAGGLTTQGEMTVLLPDNWNGVDKIVIWLLPGEGWIDVPFDITINAGTCGEAPATHTQTVNGTLITAGNGLYYCWDVTSICSTVIGNMSPRDLIWIIVTEQWGVAGYVMGVEIQET